MHARFVALTLISLSVFTVAAVLPRGNDSCSTGPQQCCNEVRDVGVPSSASPLSLLDLPSLRTDFNGQVVCCQNNSFNGMFALGCSSINMPL
ncbi:hypothetical protein AMATHDRAFT_147588 [Amanita thiersii Skay4041]|uniref:Hydrophobin n=1 Tax=Amanita thiersii Skay4041 TaxID=703135 RepID=A0A2A9NMN0_9AGAR|nr:hypothetical protein AMATHDRAFT_147588 [Amanita thiersii Skay4041]